MPVPKATHASPTPTIHTPVPPPAWARAFAAPSASWRARARSRLAAASRQPGHAASAASMSPPAASAAASWAVARALSPHCSSAWARKRAARSRAGAARGTALGSSPSASNTAGQSLRAIAMAATERRQLLSICRSSERGSHGASHASAVDRSPVRAISRAIRHRSVCWWRISGAASREVSSNARRRLGSSVRSARTRVRNIRRC